MDVGLTEDTTDGSPEAEYTLIQRLAGLLAGAVGIYAFFIPSIRADAEVSVQGFNIMSLISSEATTGTLSLPEYIGIVSVGTPVDGNLIMFLSAGGAVLIVAGALTEKLLTAVGGVMTLAGAGFLIFGLSTTTLDVLSVFELSITLQPAFGLGLLGGSGLIALFSLRL